MKYRIKQIEEETKISYMPSGLTERFYPQYKKFIKWKNFTTWHKGPKWNYVEDVSFDDLKEALLYVEKLIPKKPIKKIEPIPVKEPVFHFVN